MNILSSKACLQSAVHCNPLIPLNEEARAAIPTKEAAFHLSLKTQTLRIWACKDNGPIRPIRCNGRLLWSVADLRKLLGVAQ
jgi:hypothetical protein